MYKSREIETRVRDSLRVFRVVSLTGARQVGKTTLVQRLCREDGRQFVSLEDPVERAAAHADPDGWLEANPAPLAIDEIQHVPALFPALKRRVDRDSRPGRYLITGSALWLSMKSIGESLAGRTAILELWPFRPSEWRSMPWRWDRVLGPDDGPVRSVRAGHAVGAAVWERILRGGYPEPAGFASAADRRTWHESYLRTYLQRDVLDLVRVERMAEFTRLIRLLAAQTGALANQSALARDLGLPQPTVRRHIEWLRTTYQCHELPPYSANLGKRLVKTPKRYWSDTGMAAALAGLRDREAIEAAQKSGAMVETWVVNDLRAWSSQSGGATLFFWRAHDGGEVDVLIEMGGVVVGVEIKAGHRVDARDLKGLRECRAALGSRFRRGIVLYGGAEPHALEDRLFALPLATLLGE
ncbi:MAG: ATP-binding protein [Spirochaetes bacterium]|nr:ATP-binding protein [Spirochaetota bacterium]